MRLLFLSHSGADKSLADAVGRQLSEWGYESTFIYWDEQTGISGGTDWTRELYQKLRQAGAVIALYTPAYFESKWCFAEVTAARLLGKPLIPLRATPQTTIPTDLQAIQAIDYQDELAKGFPRLERALRQAGLAAVDSFAPDPERPPYPGLASFEEQDAAVFFGRQTEIAGTLEALQRMGTMGDGGLLLIAGASGSGKSSLLRAGILPRLGKMQSGRWLVLPALQPRQGLSPLVDLRAALGCQGVDREDVLARVAAISHEKGIPNAKPILAIDQLEQLFVDQPPLDTTQFLELLASLATRPSPIVVIGVMRSDFLDRFQTHPRLRDLEHDLFSVGLLPRSRFVEIVQGPADVYGLVFEPPTLAQRIANEAGSDEALPLVAFALRAMWEPARREGIIRESLYESLFGADTGGISGAVARTASQIVASLGAVEQQALRRAFVQLVRFDLNDKPVRRQARWSDLPPESHKGLEKLVNARLLTSYGEGQNRFIDVAHESLFRVWPELAGWIRDDHAFHIWHRNLLEAFQLWQREEANTLKGKSLATSEQWLKERGEDLSSDERRFIQASVAVRDREARQKRALALAGVAGVLVALGALIYVMYGEIERQRELSFRSLVAQSRSARALAIEGDAFSGDLLNQSLLLAVEAVGQKAADFEALEVLQESLALAHRSVTSTPITGASRMMVFSDGGDYLARIADTGLEILNNQAKKVLDIPISVDEQTFVEWAGERPVLAINTASTLSVWTITQSRELWNYKRQAASSGCGLAWGQISLDAHGSYVASIDGAVVKLWELPTGREVFSATQSESLCMVSVSPGGRYLALSDEGRKTVLLLDRSTGRKFSIPVSVDDGQLMSFTFDARGRQLLTATTYDVDLWEWDSNNVERVRNVLHWRGEDMPSPIFARLGEDGGTVGVLGDDSFAASVSAKRGARPREFASIAYGFPFGFIGERTASGLSVWDLTSGQRVANLLFQGRADDFFAYDARSERVALSSDSRLFIYEAQGGQELRRYRAPVGATVLAEPYKRFATLVRESDVIIVDTETTTEVGRLHTTGRLLKIDVDGSGARAATFDDSGTFCLWDLRASRQLWSKRDIPVRFEDDDGDETSNVLDVNFSQDGNHVRLNAKRQGGVWDAATGRDSSVAASSARPATSPLPAATSPDGRWSSIREPKKERNVLIQDQAGKVYARLKHDGDVLFSLFARDGHSVVTASEDGLLRAGLLRAWLWQADDLMKRACAVVIRPELTEEEWRDAFGTAARRPTCPPQAR